MIPGTMTGFYGSLFALFFLFLSFRVVLRRRKYLIGVGDADNHDMARAIRVHANASEYAPLTLILLLCYELSKGNVLVIHLLGVSFLLSRVIHFSGLAFKGGYSFGRAYGTSLNYLIILALCGLNMFSFAKNMFGL